MAQWTTWMVAMLCVTVIGSDLYARRVPNVVLLSALCLGAVSISLQGGWQDWPAALTGMLLALLVFFPVYLRGWMGAGDVKLFAVLGFLFGPWALGLIWLVSVPLLLVHGLVAILGRRLLLWARLQPSLAHVPAPCAARLSGVRHSLHNRLQRARGERSGAPYAAHLGTATLVLLLSGRIA